MIMLVVSVWVALVALTREDAVNIEKCGLYFVTDINVGSKIIFIARRISINGIERKSKRNYYEKRI